jgi:deazaflavin-dependent oxidoreductase (nitroreductase family)
MADMPADMRQHNRKLIEDFRTNGAPVGRRLLLLTTTGARSGKARTTPLMYVPDGDRLLVIAANAGAQRNPDWYYNAIAHPAVRVEVGDQDYEATAHALEGQEYTDVFDWIATDYPFFGEYQENVERTIPVIALTRF